MIEEEKRKLLEIARESIAIYLEKEETPKFEVPSGPLTEERGVFVTLHRGDELRGCIGVIEASDPLVDNVVEMSIAAATRDPRFPSVKLQELSDISIEISILTVPQKIKSIDEIQIGRDGLIIKKGFYRGLLLPQVAPEHNWDLETFLEHTAMKAGLPPDAWKKGAEIYRFSAEIFKEKE